ncbi:hypothetical protein [Pseudoruegeria sp. SK021]|uniref:hypothetical protein n=1 Tax=Pseudoruegeria sp. SK021 TaxID=1933035 RepID=UPI001981595A|nr:hypothetical protein [Pseudoruegeria sp. SK021]
MVRLLIEEVVIDIDATKNEFVLLLHWIGGRHTEVRLARRKTGRFPPGQDLAAGEVLRKLGGHWPDRELAVTLNRMRCRTDDGETWTTVRVAALRDSLAIPAYDPDAEVPTSMCDTRPGPGRPRSIRRDGSGAWAKASQQVQAMRGRMNRRTTK